MMKIWHKSLINNTTLFLLLDVWVLRNRSRQTVVVVVLLILMMMVWKKKMVLKNEFYLNTILYGMSMFDLLTSQLYAVDDERLLY